MRPLKDYPGYHIDEEGSVWSTLSRAHGLDFEPHRITRWKKNGYWAVTLRVPKSKNPGRQVSEYVHRLVLETFVGPCPDGQQCLHADGNRLNATLLNLSWGTHSANQMDRLRHGTDNRGERHAMHKLSIPDVIEIRKLLAAGFQHKWLAAIYGVFKSTISHIAIGNTWAWLEEVDA